MNAPALSAADSHQLMERVLSVGDLSQLTPAERNEYYSATCKSVGLNPFTRPLIYIVLNGKLTLYATKGASDQLRKLHGVSLRITREEFRGDLYVVTCEASDREGRTDSDMGVVSTAGLRGDALANATMRAVSKAKRRTTLSLCGLGFLDESEIESIPATARKPWREPEGPDAHDPATGEVASDGTSAELPEPEPAPAGEPEPPEAALEPGGPPEGPRARTVRLWSVDGRVLEEFERISAYLEAFEKAWRDERALLTHEANVRTLEQVRERTQAGALRDLVEEWLAGLGRDLAALEGDG